MTRSQWLALLLPVIAVLVGIAVVFELLNRFEEQALIQKEQSLQTSADSMAEILARDQRFLQEVGARPAQNYYHHQVVERPVLDGRDTDWAEIESELIDRRYQLNDDPMSAEGSLSYELKLATDTEFLYLHYQVADDTVVYREINHPSVHRNDHIRIALIDQEGQFRRYTIATFQPGHLEAVEVGRSQRALRTVEEITGRWLATDAGYNVELQIPRTLLANRFSTLVADVDDADRQPCCLLGKSHTGEARQLGYLIQKPTPLEAVVEAMPWPANVEDATGRLLIQSQSWPEQNFLSANAFIRDGELMLGKITLRSSSGSFQRSWMERRRLTAIAAVFVLILCFAAVWYSTHQIKMKHAEAAAEVERVSRYNEYLERMASRLNHELQTPVSVIRSSLEQLEAMSEPNQVYLERAMEGLRRLSNILEKMSEARRLEEALDEDEIDRFNLVEVVSGCVEGYRLAYPAQNFELHIEAEDVPITGIAELLAQCLDKVVDNAVEFSTGAAIRVRLNVEDNYALLRIMNEGPQLPTTSIDSLFESMVSHQQAAGDHLGLGLYVAKTITEYHGGEVSLRNRDDVGGVVATIKLPILRVTAKLFRAD